jgi:uncharacterized FlaG/YvyC family protein
VEPSAVAAQLYQVYQTYLDRLSVKINRGNEASSNYQQMDGRMKVPTLDPTQVDDAASQEISKIAPELGVSTVLKFRVDPETQKVTVMVVDRASNKVVSTIPPEAMKDIPVGDLLQYSI